MSENNGTTKPSGPASTPGGSVGDAWTSARAEAIRRQTVYDAPRRSSGWPWAITGIAIAFAAGLLANPWFEAEVRSRLPEPLRRFGAADAAGGASGEQLARLEARLAQLEARPAGEGGDLQPLYDRIAALEARAGAVPPGSDAPLSAAVADAGLAPRIAALEARLATIDQTVTTAAAQAQTLQNAHAQLDTRVTQFATETKTQLDSLQAQGAQARTLVLAAAIRRALDSGQPIGGAVNVLAQSLGQDDPNVAALQAVANGAPTLRQLRQRLENRKAAALAKASPETSGPWYERIGASLRSLVQVRRADAPASAMTGDAASQLEAMDRRLAQGDLSGALAVGEALQPQVRSQIEPVLVEMRALVAARQALSRVEAAALAG